MRHTLPLAPQFYVTAPQPCPYLEGRMERKLFTALGGEHAQELNDALSKQGFRRSQNVLYRPSCVECSACLSARIRVADFRPDRTMRRVAKRNAGLERKVLAPRATREQFLLFRRYLDRRHAQGGMADMSEGEFAAMIEETPVRTRIVEYRSPPGEAGEDGPGARNGRQARGMPGASPEAPQGAPRGTSRAASGAARQDTSRGAPPEPSPDAPWGAAWTERRGALQAVCLTDVLDDGLSMVYSFFRPEEAARSLGTQVILDHVALAREAGLPYLYLGYWVPGSPQMGYKARFSALELFVGGAWQPIGDPAGYSSALHPLSTDPIAEQVARIALPDIQPGR